MADRRSIEGEDVGRLAAAVAAGYLLGRTRRLKWAIGVSTWYLSRRYGIRPGEMVLEAGQRLMGADELKLLRRQAVRYGGRQARGMLNNGIEQLADSLHQRTLHLTDGGESDEDGSDGEQRPRRQAPSAPRRRSSGEATSRPRRASSEGPSARRASSEGRSPRRAPREAAARPRTAARRQAR